MVYSSQNEAFIKDKQKFFSIVYSSTNLEEIDIGKLIADKDYTFLLKNQQALETEFNQMFAAIQKGAKDSKDYQAFWFYLYYCASLLEAFHRAYSQHEKEKEFKDLKQQIAERIDAKTKLDENAKTFIESMRQKISANFWSLLTIPFHASQIKDNVAYVNLCRIYWLFCRLSLTQGLTIARDLQLIDKLDVILGTHTNVDKIISVFQAPIGVINYFSVGLFLARFLIDGGLLVKHTFFPTDGEQNTTRWDRFKHELYKRHCNFANDLVWASINFLTNFNHITHISGTAAAYITAGFLTFDVCMAFYKLHLAKQEYLTKKAQYTQELEVYTNPNNQLTMGVEDTLAHIDMLNKQITELDINWKTKEATFHFVAAAAVLLATGFTLSLLLTPPALLLVSFFACQVAVAMYLSLGSFTQYKEKSLRLRLEEAQLRGPNSLGNQLALAQKEYEIARNEFVFTMIKNTVVPTVLIATFAICWPAALVLTAFYVGFEAYHAYSQHAGKNEAKKIASEAFEVETDGSRLFTR